MALGDEYGRGGLRLVGDEEDERLTPEQAAEFERLYRSSYRYVFSYLCSMLMNRSEAEDVASEAFLKAAKAFRRFDPSRASFSTWVVSIARNCAVNRMRRSAHEMPADDILESYEPVAEPDRYEGLDDSASKAKELLSVLDEEDRQLVHLRFFEGLQNKEIAEVMGMNASTVGTRLSRAMAKMRSAAGDWRP